MGKFRTIWLPISLALFSLVLQIISSTPFADGMINDVFKPESIEKAKGIINLICYVAFVAPITFQAALRGTKANKYHKLLQRCGEQECEMLYYLLSKENYISGNKEEISIRIFQKKWRKLVLIGQYGNSAHRISNDLSFSMKEKQGLCVQAYEKGNSMLEEHDATRPEYHLNSQQLALVRDLKFVAAVPIVTPDGEKSKIVVCFDAFQKIANPGCAQGILKKCETVAYDLVSLIQ